MFLKSIWEIFWLGHFTLATDLCQMFAQIRKRCFWETRPCTLFTRQWIQHLLFPQIYAQSPFWKYDYIFHLCYTLLTLSGFKFEIQSVLLQFFRCEIHEVRGLDFLRGFASFLHGVGDEAGHAAVSAIKKIVALFSLCRVRIILFTHAQ